MNQPKLKYPRLCRILTYIVVIGTGLLPTIVFFNLPVPDGLKVIVLLGSLIGLLIYLIRNFLVLMMMDMVLAMESCYRTARSKYYLPQHRSADAIRSSILRYGVSCDPSPIKPTPSALRYKFSNPMTVYSRGIEKVVVAYEIDLLTRICTVTYSVLPKQIPDSLPAGKRPVSWTRSRKSSRFTGLLSS